MGFFGVLGCFGWFRTLEKSTENQQRILQKAAKDKGYTDTVFFVDAAVIIGLKTLRLKKCWKFGIF